jgi:prepilin-type N-terminal cleavage/methylation domain-containing protein
VSSGRGGFTLIETVIALSLALVVLLALGTVMLLNQRAYGWGRDKIVLQQNVSDSLERMSRLVRASHRLSVASTTEFSTYDEDEVLTHTVRRVTPTTTGRLQQDGSDLVDRACTLFDVRPNADTTALRIQVELQDGSGNRVLYQTRAALRSRDYRF